MPAPKPTFKFKGRCVVSDHPKLKRDNVVLRGSAGLLVVERVVGKAKRRMIMLWPKNLQVVVRGALAEQVTDYVKASQPKNYPVRRRVSDALKNRATKKASTDGQPAPRPAA